MLNSQQQQALLQRAKRAFGDVSPAEAVARTRQIVGPSVIPESEQAARSAMEKLTNGEKPTADEVVALEFVIRMMRPAPLVIDDHLGELPKSNLHPQEVVDRWNSFRETVQSNLRSIGRIDHPQLGQIGTGFIVAPGVVATNRHVLDQLSGGSGIVPKGAFIRFLSEDGRVEPPASKVKITRVINVHPTLDIALLGLETDQVREPLLLDTQVQMTTGDPVAVIGYPAASASNPLFSDAIFEGKYGVKRGAMGEAIDPSSTWFYHDCTTLNGNSGSPVFSLTTSRVVGIHRSGAFLYRNEAIPAREVHTLVHQD